MPRAHKRLDQAMNDRRVELDMTWGEVATRARIAEVTLRAIRKGDNNPGELTARRIEDALQWEHGSIDAVLNGGEPTPQTNQRQQDWYDYIAQASDEERELIVAFLRAHREQRGKAG